MSGRLAADDSTSEKLFCRGL